MNAPEPFTVADAVDVVVTGQMTYGNAVGVRIDGVDGILMAPSYAAMMRLLSRLPENTEVYGLSKLIQRKVIVGEDQLSASPKLPVPEVQEVSMRAWDETAPGGL